MNRTAWLQDPQDAEVSRRAEPMGEEGPFGAGSGRDSRRVGAAVSPLPAAFRALLDVFAAKGLPASLYTDRGSHYFFTPKAGESVDKERLTQVGRALDRLGIEHIAAYSAGALGADVRHAAGSPAEGELKLAGIAYMVGREEPLRR